MSVASHSLRSVPGSWRACGAHECLSPADLRSANMLSDDGARSTARWNALAHLANEALRLRRVTLVTFSTQNSLLRTVQALPVEKSASQTSQTSQRLDETVNSIRRVQLTQLFQRHITAPNRTTPSGVPRLAWGARNAQRGSALDRYRASARTNGPRVPCAPIRYSLSNFAFDP